jgi:hypothetical protein
MDKIYRETIRQPGRAQIPKEWLTKTPLIYEFFEFRIAGFLKFMRGCIKTIKEACPDKPLWTRYVGYFNNPYSGLYTYRHSKLPWDIWTNHDCLSQSQQRDDPLQRSLAPWNVKNYTYSINRYFKKPMGNEECHTTIWDSRFTTDPVELRACCMRELWREFSWGKTYLEFECMGRPWADWNDSILETRFEGRTIRYSSGVLPLMREKAERLLSYIIPNTEIKSDGIGILEPVLSPMISVTPRASLIEANRILNRLFNKHYQSFFIPEEAIADGRETLEEFKVIIVPATTHLLDGISKKLIQWVKKGGTLICSGPVGVYDKYGRWKNNILTENFGIYNIKFVREPPRWMSKVTFFSNIEYENTSDWNWHIEYSRLSRNTEVIARFNDDSVAVLSRTEGKGKIILSMLSLAQNSWGMKIIEETLASAIPTRLADCDNQYVETMIRDGTAGRFLFMINHSRKDTIDTNVTLGEEVNYIANLNLEKPVPIPVQRHEGKSVFRVVLNRGQGSVYAIL